MQMFIKMREYDSRKKLITGQERRNWEKQDDIKREQQRSEDENEREERRERDRERREQKREEGHHQLLAKLKESQPAVPQMVNITQTKLPLMKETDNIEAFIKQLEIAFKSAGIDKRKWRHHLLTQLTVSAHEPVVHLLENDDIADYDDIKETLLGRQIMSHAAAAEAFHSLGRKQFLDIQLTQIFSKLDKWLVKGQRQRH